VVFVFLSLVYFISHDDFQFYPFSINDIISFFFMAE
jgi:hypothetical protein